MTGYLVDTSILSVFGPGRPPVPHAVGRWMDRQGTAQTLFVPAIAIAEIERGIARLYRSGGVARAAELTQWLDGLLERFAGNILTIDEAVARRAGRIDDAATAAGRHPGLADVLIAATAAEHRLTILTANVRHFEPLGVWCWNILVDLPTNN